MRGKCATVVSAASQLKVSLLWQGLIGVAGEFQSCFSWGTKECNSDASGARRGIGPKLVCAGFYEVAAY